MKLSLIEELKLVPVVVANDLEQGKWILQALNDGNLNIAEITFRTECAKDVIKLGRKLFPKMLIGAGTIINAKQCLTAIESGAEFIVSPGYSKEVLDVCRTNGVRYLPGAVTPTEIMQVIDEEIDVIKFFPAEVYGGLKAIKALSAPFNKIKFLPTGGVNLENINDFLNFDKIYAVGGSFMIGKDYNSTLSLIKIALDTIKANNTGKGSIK